ncbi:MAG: V-type ATPase subunit [Endomicrobia bacterium]|nr:V-type ATPase subunit [Endomicrobiia bacterium]
MNYTYQVAYLNTLRVKKIIPATTLQELESTKNMLSLISALKEYKYDKIFSFTSPDTQIYDATLFESIIQQELNYTLSIIDTLLFQKDKWLVEWLSYFLFYSENKNFFDFNKYIPLFNGLGSELCKKLLKLVIDFENIKLFLSYILLKKSSVEELKFISCGNIPDWKFKELFPSIDTLTKYLTTTFYPHIKISTSPEKINFNFYFKYYLSNLIWESKLYFFTIEPIVFYFEKLLETQKLKEIYYDIKLNTQS